MILGGLAAEAGFAARELLAMTIDDARFWWNAIAAFRKAQQEE